MSENIANATLAVFCFFTVFTFGTCAQTCLQGEHAERMLNARNSAKAERACIEAGNHYVNGDCLVCPGGAR